MTDPMDDPRGHHPLKAPLRSATGGGLAAFHPYSRAGERGRPGYFLRNENGRRCERRPKE